MNIGDILTSIVNFDCQPSVFSVSVIKSDHRTGFDCVAEFRSTHKDALSSISAHSDTPEEAAAIVLKQLEERWSKCPTCNRYRHETH